VQQLRFARAHLRVTPATSGTCDHHHLRIHLRHRPVHPRGRLWRHRDRVQRRPVPDEVGDHPCGDRRDDVHDRRRRLR
jgi:hypothetical protein